MFADPLMATAPRRTDPRSDACPHMLRWLR
jgi:hypothetical protein